MYNQEIKERFLSERYVGQNGTPTQTHWFNAFEPKEFEMQKDIAEMNSTEAMSAVISTKIYERKSLESILSMLKYYVKWCKDNQIFTDIPGGILEVKLDSQSVTQAVSQKLFRDENDLLYSMRKVYPFDEGSPEVAAVILAWLGLNLEQILELQDSQVDLVNGKIYAIDGGVLVSDISHRMREVLTEYVRCESAKRMNGNTDHEVIKDKSFPNFIKQMKSRTSTQMGKRLELKAIRDMFDRVNRKYKELGYESRFVYTNVLQSGQLHRLLELELSGIDVMDSKNAAVVEAVFNGKKKFRSIKWAYESYKKAFNF